MKNFIKKSIQYPNWWISIGSGYPRNRYLDFLYKNIGSKYFNKPNPIYKTFWWTLKEAKIDYDKLLYIEYWRGTELVKIKQIHQLLRNKIYLFFRRDLINLLKKKLKKLNKNYAEQTNQI